jgi:tetratricopeptide (TPR) repeat protein
MNPRAEQVFFTASSLSSQAERAAYLREACAGDPALLREVEARLQAREQTRTPAALTGDSSETATVAVGSPGPRTEQPGDRIGRYKLLQQIGEGGCGVVYMAEQEEPVRRRVALKIIKLGMDTRRVVARFEAERQALALMDHPHIAKVLDAGATDSGRPFFVMELVRGVRITEYCDQQKLGTRERLELFMLLCQAIQHAHQKGVIHRDIKPSNVLVALHDGKALPMVIDFGIAKATQQQLTDKTLFTEYHQLIGTPAYMSPEQAEAGGLDIDTRSDIYSLGVLLYELLTGRTPFDPEQWREGGLQEFRRHMREEEPPRPSTRLSTMTDGDLTSVARHRHAEPQRLTSQVRGELDWIVMKSIEKDRARRYESASALAEDIQRFLRHEPVSAAAPGAWYRFKKFARRHQGALAASGAIAALLVAGVVVSAWQAARATRARRAADHAARKSEQVAAFLTDMLQSVGPAVALGRDTRLLLEVVDKAAARVGRDLKDQPEVEAELRDTIGRTYYDLGDLAKAEPMLREALRLGKAAFRPDSPRTAGILNNLATTLQAAGNLKEAEALQREALAIYRQRYGGTNDLTATALNNLAGVLWAAQQLPDAEALYRQALGLYRELLGPTNAPVATVLNNLGSVLQARGDLVQAEQLYRNALVIRQQLHPEPHPDVMNSLNNLGNALFAGGDTDGARTQLDAGVAMSRALYPEAHPQAASARYNLANVLLAGGDLDGAESRHREALAMRQKLFGESHADVAGSLHGVARVMQARGDVEGAEPLLRKALAIDHERLGEPHPQSLACRRALAQSLARRGRWREAAVELTRLTELAPADHWNWFLLAPALVEQGDPEVYRRWRRDLFARFGQTNDPIVAERIAKAGLLLPAAGAELETATRLATKALEAAGPHPFAAYFELARGLAEYRQGRPAAAVDWLRKCQSHGDTPPNIETPARLLLAMAEAKSAQGAGARDALRAAIAQAEAASPRLDARDLGPNWQDAAIARILIEEAKRLAQAP